MKAKLPIALLILVLLAGYYLMGNSYLKQRRYSERLTYQIAEATRTLALMPQSPTDMEQRLALAQANLTATESSFPSRVNSTRVINAILKLADDVGVKAIPLVTRPWSEEKAGAHNYYVLHLNVFVTGGFSGLIKFMDGLEKGEFPTLIIEQLSVASEVKPSVEEEASELAAPVSASLDLAVYARSPPTD